MSNLHPGIGSWLGEPAAPTTRAELDALADRAAALATLEARLDRGLALSRTDPTWDDADADHFERLLGEYEQLLREGV